MLVSVAGAWFDGALFVDWFTLTSALFVALLEHERAPCPTSKALAPGLGTVFALFVIERPTDMAASRSCPG